MPTLILNPTKDCTINLAAPTTADNSASLEMSRNTGGTAKKRMLMEFDLSSIPAGAMIESAELTMNNTGGAFDAVATINFYRLTTAWTEAATWNTSDGAAAWTTPGGDYTSTLGLTISGGGSPGDISIGNPTGLDDLVVDAYEDRSGILSLIGALDVSGAGDTSWIGDSSESSNASNRPTLTVTYQTNDPADVVVSDAAVTDVAVSDDQDEPQEFNMGFNRHNPGALVVVRGAFTNHVSGSALDPTTVKVSVRDPAGTLSTFTYNVGDDITRDSAGNFSYEIDADQVGRWTYRWWSTGVGQAAAEAFFVVRDSDAMD